MLETIIGVLQGRYLRSEEEGDLKGSNCKGTRMDETER